MAKLQISGQVLYSDLSPAEGAEVKIFEHDLGPGGTRDKILTRVTNAQGKFSGLSSEWVDREGVVLGINLPDVLNLSFAVKAAGKTHTGPFILVGGASAPIVLPFGPIKPVAKAARDLVQVILLSDGFVGAERQLYKFIEASSEGIAATILGPQYRKIHVLKGNNATLTNFKNKLRDSANTAGVKAVDILFNTHGASNKVFFKEGGLTTSAVKTQLLTLAAGVRAKFRAAFSTACFGETHRSLWTSVGFNAAEGSVGIYADSAVSFAPLLMRWATEGTFAEVVQVANAADIGNAADNLAIAYYRNTHDMARAAQVNSTRVMSGDTSIRIYSAP
jgi:hypothetical protein